MQPFDKADTQLLELIEDHYQKLVKALQRQDTVRAAFEAAWLSHAVVDGLTPAHHYPYEEKLVELGSGRSIKERTTIRKKLVMPGHTKSKTLTNNWKMWGPKGLFTTHAAFEWGVAVLMAPLRLSKLLPTPEKLAQFENLSLNHWFRTVAQDIARMELYDAFYATGWTIALARRIRLYLAPAIVQAVTIIWYGAIIEAGLAPLEKQTEEA